MTSPMQTSISTAPWGCVCYTAYMSGIVVVSILQGAAAVLAFSRTSEFLTDELKSYVREEDGAVILRMVGGHGIAIFCLEWVALTLAFILGYYAYDDRECGGNPMRRSAKDGAGNWPWPFQILQAIQVAERILKQYLEKIFTGVYDQPPPNLGIIKKCP